jgi:hypothetical protein
MIEFKYSLSNMPLTLLELNQGINWELLEDAPGDLTQAEEFQFLIPHSRSSSLVHRLHELHLRLPLNHRLKARPALNLVPV